MKVHTYKYSIEKSRGNILRVMLSQTFNNQNGNVRTLSRVTIFTLLLIPFFLILTDPGNDEEALNPTSEDPLQINLSVLEANNGIKGKNGIAHIESEYELEEATVHLLVDVQSTFDEEKAEEIVSKFLVDVSERSNGKPANNDHEFFGEVWDHTHLQFQFATSEENVFLTGEVLKGTHTVTFLHN